MSHNIKMEKILKKKSTLEKKLITEGLTKKENDLFSLSILTKRQGY